MYTDTMRRAFKSLEHYCPKGFGVEIIDNDMFITLRVDPDALSRLAVEDQQRAVQYTVMVKQALEQEGGIVLLVRKAKDD